MCFIIVIGCGGFCKKIRRFLVAANTPESSAAIKQEIPNQKCHGLVPQQCFRVIIKSESRTKNAPNVKLQRVFAFQKGNLHENKIQIV